MLRDESGSILMLTFLFIMVLAITTGGYVFFTNGVTSLLLDQSREEVNHYHCEAGVQWRFRKALNQGELGYLSGDYTVSRAGWLQRDTLYADSGNYRLTATPTADPVVITTMDEAGKINLNSITGSNRNLLRDLFLAAGYLGTDTSALGAMADTIISRRLNNWQGLSPGGNFTSLRVLERIFAADGLDNDADGSVDETGEGISTLWGSDRRPNHWLDPGEATDGDGGVASLARLLTVFSTRDTRSDMGNRAPVNVNTASHSVLRVLLANYSSALPAVRLADSLISGRYYRNYLDFQQRLHALILNNTITAADSDSVVTYAAYKNHTTNPQKSLELNFMSKTFDLCAEIDDIRGVARLESVLVDTARSFYTYDNSNW